MHLTLLAYGHTICNESWKVETLGETFHRLYYVTGGTCHCEIQGKTVTLLPYHLYLFPQNTPYTMEQDVTAPLQVVWQHFRPGDCQFAQGLWSLPVAESSGAYHLLQAMELLSKDGEFFQADPELSANISKLLHVLLSLVQETLPILAPLDPRIAQAIHLANHHPKAGYTVQDLADYAKLERSHFSRLFLKQLGITPQVFLLRIRLELSAQMLLQGQSVAQVASEVGYSDEKAFFRAFSRHFGTSPGKYRKNHILQP